MLTEPSQNSSLKEKPRKRQLDPNSEGESESEDPMICFRALRPNEDPINFGLQPPSDYDSDKSIVAHITAGSKAKTKSGIISASRSIKVPAAWAKGTKNNNVPARVCKFSLKGLKEIEDYRDLTNEKHLQGLNLGCMALNQAKASQEVVILKPVPKENIIEIYLKETPKAGEYDTLKNNNSAYGNKCLKTRRKASEDPKRIVLKPTLNNG